MGNFIKEIEKIGVDVAISSLTFNKNGGDTSGTMHLKGTAEGIDGVEIIITFKDESAYKNCVEFILKNSTVATVCCDTIKEQEVPPAPKPEQEVYKEVKTEKQPQQESQKTSNNIGISLPPMNGSSSPSMSVPKEYSRPAPPVAPKEEATPQAPPVRNSGIRDVQMLAIQAMLKLRKVNYEELVSEAFKENNIESEAIPSIEKLTEEQALEIIRYGNNKFKKQQ